jgi:GntR family transcriptional regulator/MocR family aminotransferase
MPAPRRARLAELALTHRFAIMEDDYDHEFHYAGAPILPIAAGPGRRNTVYIGSLANLLAPGVSAAFVVAPPAVFERIWRLRAISDARGDAAIECALAELLEDGELLRHTQRMRQVYAARRDCLVTALERQLGSALAFTVPDGGMAIWARIDDAIDVASWESAGEREGVVFQSARSYHFRQGEQRNARLGFSYLDELELEEAVRRMARALGRTRVAQRVVVAQAAETRAA